MTDPREAVAGPAPRTQLLLLVPALAVGIVSALTLWLLDEAAHLLQIAAWETLPDSLGVARDSPWVTLTILTATGLAVGLVVQFLPGHAGFDSASTELDSPPPPVTAVPSLALAVTLSLAGGVSLGPENPIIAINGALMIAVFTRFLPGVPQRLALLLAVAGTVGALFGTPVAAALLFTGALAASKEGGSLWDKLFLPVAAAAAGAVTMRLIGVPPLGFDVDPYPGFAPVDLVSGIAIAAVSAGLGILAAVLFPLLHRAFHALRHPVLFTTLGGLVLGVLGVIGGPLTLFKGLEQTEELLASAGSYLFGTLVVMVLVKLAALLVAASSGFRGGRIFPAVFIGVAVGLSAQALFPGIPEGLAIACGAMGIVLQAMRDGWMALFIGIAVTGDISLLPLLCIIVLPVWLLVTRAPLLEVRAPAPPAST